MIQESYFTRNPLNATLRDPLNPSSIHMTTPNDLHSTYDNMILNSHLDNKNLIK